MTRRQRNYGIIIVSYLLIISLVYLSYDYGVFTPFALLFLPLILVAGYWEETFGALVVTATASMSMVVFKILDFIDPMSAMTNIICFGLMFGFTTLLNYDRDSKNKARQNELEPQKQNLHVVKHKAVMIRNQIEGYEKRLKGLVKLNEVAKLLAGILELQPMIDEARSIVAKLMSKHFDSNVEDQTRLAIYIPEEESKNFQRMGTRGLEVSDEGFPEKIKAYDLQQWLGEDFNSVRIKDLDADPRFNTLSTSTIFRSMIAVPLIMHEIVIGVLMIASTKVNAFNPTDFNKVEVLGKQIVFALRKALLYRKVQTLSFTDSQTGLYVHRFFQERLNEELLRAERYSQSLSLIMLDMDYFKKVNDQHGHQMGDIVLIEAAKRIKEMAGPTALVARYGGEEFAVVLPNINAEKAFQVGQSINAFMKASTVKTEEVELTITVSGGVSSYPEFANDQEALISTADSALYQAKREGRDLVILYKETE